MTRPTDPAAPTRRSAVSLTLVAAFALSIVPAATADEAGGGGAYLAFIRARAAALRAGDAPPRSLADWTERRTEVRHRLARALGPVPDPSSPLDPTNHGTLDRDGYRVEKVTFQTLPGVRMTANLYLPESPGRHPAILAVHGHWRGAKQDPVVQARCIGAAKLGFAVLAVDAFGAGERAVGKALGEYHGEMTAATLLPTGQTLAGLQVYENARALAYLATRPEVNADRVGVTGASGGGNQTMYAFAMIDGLKAAVPVCSVGNYRSYLGAACCMCELVPGTLTFTEEWGVLGLAAPKPLMVVNATQGRRPVLGPRGEEDDRRPGAPLRPVRAPAAPASCRLRVGPRLQQGDARGGVWLVHSPPRRPRGRLADRRAGDPDRGPRSPPLLPGRQPPRRLRDTAEVCRGRGAATP